MHRRLPATREAPAATAPRCYQRLGRFRPPRLSTRRAKTPWVPLPGVKRRSPAQIRKTGVGRTRQSCRVSLTTDADGHSPPGNGSLHSEMSSKHWTIKDTGSNGTISGREILQRPSGTAVGTETMASVDARRALTRRKVSPRQAHVGQIDRRGSTVQPRGLRPRALLSSRGHLSCAAIEQPRAQFDSP